MLKNWKMFEKILLVVNVLIGVMFLVIGKDYSIIPILGLIASIANTICVILVAKKQISNYIWGIIGTLTYGIVAFYYTNTGEWMLNLLYYMPMNFVGWFMWYKNSNDHKKVESKKLTITQSTVVYSITALCVFLYAWLISLNNVQIFLYGSVTGFSFLKYIIDSLSTILSIVAMILMVKCYREQWVLWIIVNVASIILWCFTFDLTMILLWCTLLVNSIYGLYCWTKTN